MIGPFQTSRIALAGTFALAGLALVACGSDDEDATTAAATTTTTSTDATGADGNLESAADAAGCDVQVDLRDEGNEHLSPGAPAPKYDTTPPTSGPHNPVPTADGAYLDTPDPTGVVHSLEHGRVAIQYSPDLPEDEQLLLKGVFDEDPKGMLLVPNPDMPYRVAVTAWTNLVGCSAFGERVLDVVRDFRDEFRGRGPERLPL